MIDQCEVCGAASLDSEDPRAAGEPHGLLIIGRHRHYLCQPHLADFERAAHQRLREMRQQHMRLIVGSPMNEIEAWQQTLRDLGYLTDACEPGVFDATTTAATIKLQQSLQQQDEAAGELTQIVASGAVDAATLWRTYQLVSARKSKPPQSG